MNMNKEVTLLEPEADAKPTTPSLRDLASYYLRLGALGFGGPIALANKMRVDLVEDRQWLSEDQYTEGLALASACPGPLAYQLAIYCGYSQHGLPGALTVAITFATCPFLFVVCMGIIYTKFAGTWQLKAIFAGVTPVVVALVAKSCYQLARKLLSRNWLAIGISLVAAGITIATEQELVLLFLIGGILGVWLLKPNGNDTPELERSAKSNVQLPLVLFALLVSIAVLLYFAPLDRLALPLTAKLFAFFFRTGLMILGSGIVIVPFLQEYVVNQFHWLTQETFLDAVAVGLITPGPVVITATFVGFVLAGFGGALTATIGIFSPAVIFTVVGTPLLRRYRHHQGLQGFIKGITITVVGVLLGTAVVLGKTTLKDTFAAIVASAALATTLRFPKLPEQLLVVAGAVSGLILYLLIQH